MKYGLKGILAAGLLVAACNNAHNYPVIGGGGGGGISGGGDAGSQLDGAKDGAGDAAHDGANDAAGDATPGDGGMISGRVCLLTDLRDLTSCAPTGASGLTVTLGTSTTTTAENGDFTLAAPGGTGLVWQVMGGPIALSTMPFGGTATIPAVNATDYLNLLDANGVMPETGQGAIMTRITRAGSPIAGATASAPPAVQQYLTYYAGSNATQWTTTATDAIGTAWLPGVDPTQPVVVTVAASGGTPSTTVTVTAPDGGIVFVMADLGP